MAGFGVPDREPEVLPIGRGEVLRQGDDVLIVGFGPIVARGVAVAERLAATGVSTGVINARFAKPIDRQLIQTTRDEIDGHIIRFWNRIRLDLLFRTHV